MIWSFGEVLEYLSQDFTFVPGDVIAGGTSAGTAADKSRRGPDGKRPWIYFSKSATSSRYRHRRSERYPTK
jgi:2-keto-4-pentenoate hydratase/2-oxohepta-3-ene-1,7-dioic acid hydratase in catechol pathway